MKSSATMRSIAKAIAVETGAREVQTETGRRAAAYILKKSELQKIFELNGFNTRGVSWLNMISRWRIVGEYIPPENVLKTSEDWWIAFLNITDIEKDRLQGWAGYNEIGLVLA